MTLTVELSEDQADRLRELAATLQIDPATLARAAVVHYLHRAEEDSKGFQAAADHVLQKNDELYKRLG